MNNSIAVLIIFFNKLSQTIDCVESFIPSNQPIYVLNNGSDEQDWISLKKKFSLNNQVVFFQSNKNLGACVGRNYLIENSTEPWLLIVDNDIIVKEKESWVNHFLDFLKKHPAAEIVTFNIYNKHENQFVKPVNVIKKENRVSIETTDNAVTNCFPCTGSIVNRRIFETYGLFDPAIFVGLEEYEYSLRAIFSPQGAFKVYHLNSIELIHDHHFQKKQKDRHAVRVRYNEQMLKNNAEVISSKYNIIFDHDWHWWARKQVADLAGNTLFQKIKQRVDGLIGR